MNTPREVYHTIIATPLPAAVNSKARHLPQKERSALLRKFLKGAGINGVSVRSATGSMCFWSEVCLPDSQCSHANCEERVACPLCQQRQAAVEHLREILHHAFPDLEDRSDIQSDYFDPMFTLR